MSQSVGRGRSCARPSENVNTDIHCVTKWSKLGMTWEGVSVDTALKGVETAAEHVLAFCNGGYATNLPLKYVTDGKAWVAYNALIRVAHNRGRYFLNLRGLKYLWLNEEA